MERVLSHIDTRADRQAFLRVSREWFLMNRQFFIRQVVVDWSLESTSDAVAAASLWKLSAMGRLCWYGGRTLQYDRQQQQQREKGGHNKRREKEHWQALVVAIRRSHEQYQRQQKQQQRQRQPRALLDDSPLRELEIGAGEHLSTGLPTLLPFLGTLTRLSLRWIKDGTISLPEVIQSCPFLEHISFEAGQVVAITGLFTMSRRAAPTTPRTHLPLRSLVLRRAQLEQSHLETFLWSTPRLQTLKLIDMRTGMVASPAYSLSRLLQSLQDRSIKPTMFHCHPTAYEVIDSELQTVMFELDPTVTGWSFWARDLTAAMLESLRDVRNVVTTLEIHHISVNYTGAMSRIHQYLCESPHLLHLRAPKTAILVESMDIHGRAHFVHKGYLDTDESDKAKTPQGYYSTPDLGQRQVWACRKLQTLHCSIYSRYDKEVLSPARSRIMFGYISRLCPDLCDLQIDTPPRESDDGDDDIYSMLDLRLEGGLCLLARMGQLRTLRIGTSERSMVCQGRDLSWMTGGGGVGQKQRCSAIKGWASWLHTEQEDDKWKNQSSIRWEPLGDPRDTVELRLKAELRDVGLLLDVKLMLEEIDSTRRDGKTFQCWPALQHVSLYSPAVSALSPEKEFCRLVPPSRFDLLRPRR
ncbi:hypothetical protein BGX23_001075 [Mortierella sp. AD031]|nr:hypothetical protein BGX23_001075 [Mortierella sp. AD031]